MDTDFCWYNWCYIRRFYCSISVGQKLHFISSLAGWPKEKKCVQRCIWLKWEYKSFNCLISEHLNFPLIPLFHDYCNACSRRLTNASFQSGDAMPSSVARGFCLVIVLIQWQICQILTTIWKYLTAGLSILRLLDLKITLDDLLSLNFLAYSWSEYHIS